MTICAKDDKVSFSFYNNFSLMIHSLSCITITNDISDITTDISTEITKEPECQDTNIESLQCKICMDHQCNIVLIPCGHSSLCSCCVSDTKICPFCRTDITAKQAIFFG